MSDPAAVRQLLVEDGLEGLVPLPEAAESVRALLSTDRSDAVDLVREALQDLLRDGLVQVWAGRWDADAEVVRGDDARAALMDPEQYVFGSDPDLERRVYFVVA